MKNRIILRNSVFVIIGLVLVLTMSCKKENNNTENGGNRGIVIKGKIPANGSGKSSSLDAKSSPTLADAKKVLVFSKYYYSLTDIVDGSFSVTGQVGTGVALLFLDADNHYIGNLSTRGLNILPLGNLVNGDNTTIDLTTLSLTGNNVIPAHDPFGNEINISQTEISCMQQINGYYEAITKNIDADNDGTPDVLTNSQLVLCTHYGIYGGRWGLNETAPVINDTSHYYVNYGVEVGGGSALTFSNGNITLVGPVGNPDTDIKIWGYMMAPQCGANRGFIASFSRETHAPIDAPWGSAFLPFKDGIYTLTIDGNKSYTLDYSCVDIKYNLVIVVPTLHTNSEGKLTLITFEYQLPNGTKMDPANMINNVMVQFSDNTAHQFYMNDKKLTTETGFTVITPETPVDISALNGINIEYDDLLGNHYSIVWK
jgi:hypothetical protein